MMKTFNIRVITNAKRGEILDLGGGALKVKLTVPPVDGRANKELIKVLAEYFGVKKRDVIIRAGLKSRNKVVEVVE
ncbi:DUF167 domain-containing protein [Patescibacteria group bacterium]|nr:DUF167 domain-containing protein [Patescibacteria group bacterium]